MLLAAIAMWLSAAIAVASGFFIVACGLVVWLNGVCCYYCFFYFYVF